MTCSSEYLASLAVDARTHVTSLVDAALEAWRPIEAAFPTDNDARAVADEVAIAFSRAGFTVDWDRNPDRRIELTGANRQHRRNGRR